MLSISTLITIIIAYILILTTIIAIVLVVLVLYEQKYIYKQRDEYGRLIIVNTL